MSALSPFEQRILDDVEKWGWFGMSVVPEDNDDDGREWWTYTVGLPKSYLWPELIVFGLDATDGHSMVAAAIEECKTKHCVPYTGQRLFTNTPGFHCLLADGRDIPSSYFNSANWFARFHGMNEPDRLHLLWPDEDGRFPFEDSCDAICRDLQTPRQA